MPKCEQDYRIKVTQRPNGAATVELKGKGLNFGMFSSLEHSRMDIGHVCNSIQQKILPIC